MGEGWRLRLLGPLEISHDGVPVPVASAKQRVLVAVLALAGNEPVTVDRLVACLWGERPPASARNTLQNYVLRLRRTLQAHDEPGPLLTSTAGYRLALAADAVDVHRFGALLRSARSAELAGQPETASALVEEALALWRGEPLADIPSEVVRYEVVPGLVEQRLAAQEQRVELGLRQGRHQELVTELVALTTANPLRERFWAQLMLALYRSGRTGAALDAYRQAATALAEELGIDPGPELQRLHQAVLTNDPGLTPVADASPAPAHRPGAPPVVPRQLPAPSAHFVGRASELRHLDTRLADANGAALMVISAIGGTAGIGKTTLALYWGHQHADRFPDGQLYVNLRGFDPTDTPVAPATAVRGFLTALGIPAQHIPPDLDEQIALYRSQLADRRLLVVLDNARDAQQVRPLLPGAPGCVVLVTSRDQLASLVALDGAVPLTLDLLTHEEARDLLVRRLGRDRVERDATVADELVAACARLPLAVNIAAAQAALHPARPLAQFVAELRDAHRRWDTLSTGEPAADVRAVFSWSYHALSPTAARVFRLLGLHPGPDIGVPAMASLAALDLTATGKALDELARAHLITERTPARYTLHDLLRAYAADRARAEDSQAERRAALGRVVDFYTHTTHAADRVLDPHRAPIQLDPPAPGAHPHPLAGMPAAMAWLDTEHANLLAAQQTAVTSAWHARVWQLAWALHTYHRRRGHRHDRLTVWRAAVDAATFLPDPAIPVRAHRFLGIAYADLGRQQEAIEHMNQALALAAEHDDRTEQAHTDRLLAWVWEQGGDNRQALAHATRALDRYRTLDQPTWEADVLNLVGWYAALLGDYDTARTHCQAALDLLRKHPNPEGEANTLDTLGYIDHHTGHHRQAIEHYRGALARYRALDDTYQTPNSLDHLGQSLAAVGEREPARAAWREALLMYQEQGRDQDADRLRQQLEGLG